MSLLFSEAASDIMQSTEASPDVRCQESSPACWLWLRLRPLSYGGCVVSGQRESGVQSAGGRQHASINHQPWPGRWQVKRDKANKGLCYASAMRDEEAISEHSIDLVLWFVRELCLITNVLGICKDLIEPNYNKVNKTWASLYGFRIFGNSPWLIHLVFTIQT